MTTMTTPRHQVALATGQMRGIADALVDASVWSMSAPEAATTLLELTKLEAQVVELKTRVAAHGDEVEVGTDVGATSTSSWYAHQTRETRSAAYRIVRRGYDLAIYDRVRSGLARGDLRLEQADVIIRSVKALPDGLDPELLIKAEEHLVTAAEEHDAKRLTILGRRLLEVIAPDLADQHESDLLEREEAKAAQACRLTMSDDGHGKVHGRFTLPALQAAELKKMLLALAAPKHLAATHGPGVERRPGPERMGRAFCELIERISAKDLPQVGGRDATIVVTIGLDTLLGRLEKAGVLDTGERISATAARRLACTAKIIPVVLGADSQVLDVGRSRRFFTKAQLTALSLRDGSASPTAVTGHRGCAMPTTGPDGPTAVLPTSTTPGSSARDTTPEHTTRRTPWQSTTTARSPSPDANRSLGQRAWSAPCPILALADGLAGRPRHRGTDAEEGPGSTGQGGG